VGEHRGQHELGDGPVKDAARIRHDDVGLAQPVEDERVDAGRGYVDPLQAVAPVPHLLERRGEEVPEEEHLRPRQGIPEPGFVREAELQAALERLEVRRSVVGTLAEHGHDRAVLWHAPNVVDHRV
jgi:hypothetical protein